MTRSSDLLLRRAGTLLGFTMSFVASLLSLLFGIFVLKPIPVFLKPDWNIHESSDKTQKKSRSPFYIFRRTDESSENSTDSTLVNNKTSELSLQNNTVGTKFNTTPGMGLGAEGGMNSSSTVQKGSLNITKSESNSSEIISGNNKLSNTSIPTPTNSSNSSSKGSDLNKTLIISANNTKDSSTKNISGPIDITLPNSTLTMVISTQTSIPTSIVTSVSISTVTSVSTSTLTNVVTNTVISLLTKTIEKSGSIETFTKTTTSITSMETDSANVYESETAKGKSLFGEGSLIAILIPLAVFIIVFIALMWFWCRRRRKFSKVPRKRVGNYKITPIINDGSGVQRTNYSEKEQSYSATENNFNKGGYRGRGSTNTPNSKPSFSRNHSVSPSNVSPAYQKPDYYFSKNNDEKDSSQLLTSKNKSHNRLSNLVNMVFKDESQNSKSVEPRNLPTQFFNTGKNSNYSTSPYSLNSQNTMESLNRNAALLDYDPRAAQENFTNKLYSYSDVPRSLSTNYGRFSENRRNGLLRHNPSTFQRFSEKSEIHDFSRNS